jgi:hypothetical protein
MRLQRIVANRSSRLEGWTYATVGGNSCFFAPHLYSFNAWATVSAPVACGKPSLNWEQRIGSMIWSIEANPRTKNCPWIPNIPCEIWSESGIGSQEKKWRPLASHYSSHCSLLTVFSAWCLVFGQLLKGCFILLWSFSLPPSPSVTEGDRILRRLQQWT